MDASTPRACRTGAVDEAGLGPLGASLVAIVEDDAAVRDSYEFALTAMGCRSEGFASAQAFLRAEPARFACLITDQRMPGMSGIALAAHLRDIGVKMPIMLVSGTLSPEEQAQATKAGIECALHKPTALTDIFAFVQGSLARADPA